MGGNPSSLQHINFIYQIYTKHDMEIHSKGATKSWNSEHALNKAHLVVYYLADLLWVAQ